MKLVFRGVIVFFFLVLTHCGAELIENEDLDGDASASDLSSPFLGYETGDDFEWGKFIRPPYQTTRVSSLPIQVYLAFFTESEESIIEEGVEMANDAVGFDVFEVVDEWSTYSRLIYKVDKVYFSEPEAGVDDYSNVIGYTYNRNVYMDDRYHSGRVVTDWAIEIRADNVGKWVVAHELGHTMGIQKHALINYEEDTLEPLEPGSIMSEIVGPNPAMGDYRYMMQMQGEILLDYMEDLK